MKRFICIVIFFLSFTSILAAQSSDYKIIVSTIGYTSIYRYTPDDLREKLKRDLRVNHDITISDTASSDGDRLVTLQIGARKFHFTIGERCRVARLNYDTNRRLFSGLGINFQEDVTVKQTPATFKGVDIEQLSIEWKSDIYRLISDKTMLKGENTEFIIDLDIDENGIVHRATEINGAPRQYAKRIIDYIYEKAARGWVPAKRNNTPYRAITTISFVL